MLGYAAHRTKSGDGSWNPTLGRSPCTPRGAWRVGTRGQRAASGLNHTPRPALCFERGPLCLGGLVLLRVTAPRARRRPLGADGMALTAHAPGGALAREPCRPSQGRGQLFRGPVRSRASTARGPVLHPRLHRRGQRLGQAPRLPGGPGERSTCHPSCLLVLEPQPHGRPVPPDIVRAGLTRPSPTRQEDRWAPSAAVSVRGRLADRFQVRLCWGRPPAPPHRFHPLACTTLRKGTAPQRPGHPLPVYGVCPCPASTHPGSARASRTGGASGGAHR